MYSAPKLDRTISSLYFKHSADASFRSKLVCRLRRKMTRAKDLCGMTMSSTRSENFGA